MRSISTLKRQKKAQVNTLGPSIIALVIAGVFLILGIVLIYSLQNADIVRYTQSGTVTSESIAVTTSGSSPVARAVDPGFGKMALTNATISNGSGASAQIATGNYTYDSTTGVITLGATLGDNFITDIALLNNTNWNVSYTYQSGDEAFVSANETTVGLANFSDFWEIIVLAIIISLVIGLLLVVFGVGRSR